MLDIVYDDSIITHAHVSVGGVSHDSQVAIVLTAEHWSHFRSAADLDQFLKCKHNQILILVF